MSTNMARTLIMALLFSFALVGCGSETTTSEPTVLPDVILTAAAQTASVRLTELALPTVTPSPEPSVTPPPPTPTESLIATATLPVLGTPTLPSAPTPTLPSGFTPSAGGDRAEMVSETILDGTDFDPDEAFLKTWAVKNTGTTTWTSAFSLAFLSGAQMGGPDSVSLTRNVAPGEVVDIPVNLIAPETSGTHRGYWKMRNASGQFFDFAFWVEIDVVGGTPGAKPTSQPGVNVTKVILGVDEASADECPHTFSFNGSFTLNRPATVTYRLEAGSTTPGFQYSLPGDQSGSFEAGTHAVTYFLDIEDQVSGWAQFHVLTPDDVVSDQVAFDLTCGP